MFRHIVRTLKNAPIINRIREGRKKAFSMKYLLYTNVVISMTLSTVGDMIEQHYQILFGESQKWDSNRSIKMGASGITVGVVCHYWYRFIDLRLPGRTLKLVIKKVLIDQFVGSPISISILFVTLGLLERKNFIEILCEMKKKFRKLYTAEWVIWPPAQIINFLWLPTQYRVLYDNTISLGYDIYTSRVKHGHDDDDDD